MVADHQLLTPFAAAATMEVDQPAEAKKIHAILGSSFSGIETALRDALNAEAAAHAEAKRWRAQAEEWRQKYEQQVQLVQLLRSHSTVSAEGTSEPQEAGGMCAHTSSGTLLEPCDEPASDADVNAMHTMAARAQRESFVGRRRTLPELPGRGRCPAVRTKLPLRDPTSALRSLQLARLASGQQDSVPPQATLGSLATMLMACSFLQPGRQISVEEAGEGTPFASADRSDSGGGGSNTDAGEQLQSHVSVEDDGASGVGAAAAAALSVALARSWASAAQQSQGMLEQTANGATRLGRAGFRLTAVRPRAMPARNTGSGNTTPSSQSPAQGGSLAASARSRYRNESAPALMKLAGDSSYGSPGGSVHGQQLMGALPPDSPSQRKSTDEAPILLGATLKLHWLSSPSSVLVVAKPSPRVQQALHQVVAWLLHRRISVVLEPQVLEQMGPQLAAAALLPADISVESGRHGGLRSWTPEEAAAEGVPPNHVPRSVADKLDLVVTLGGDGTVLWTGALLGTGPVPPLVSFALGSLGFMTPFPLDTMPSVLSSVLQGGFSMMLRHRLHCTIMRGPCHFGNGCGDGCSKQVDPVIPDIGRDEHEVLNELVMDRGMSPFLTSLDCYCDDNYVTNVQGDGLIVATPTGSTAYNLAAGGSMVHPEVPCVLFCPICPHSLTSRPLVFPEHIQLRIQVPKDSRSDMWCSFDGKGRQRLCPGDAVIVRQSRWPMPMVCKSDASHDWFHSMQQGLSWDSRQRQQGNGM